MPMLPSFEDVAKKEGDFKKLARGIWSIKRVALNVSPGDKVPLEYLFLDDPKPSVTKIVLTHPSVLSSLIILLRINYYVILYYVYHCHIKLISALSIGFSRIMWR